MSVAIPKVRLKRTAGENLYGSFRIPNLGLTSTNPRARATSNCSRRLDTLRFNCLLNSVREGILSGLSFLVIRYLANCERIAELLGSIVTITSINQINPFYHINRNYQGINSNKQPHPLGYACGFKIPKFYVGFCSSITAALINATALINDCSSMSNNG